MYFIEVWSGMACMHGSLSIYERVDCEAMLSHCFDIRENVKYSKWRNTISRYNWKLATKTQF